MKFPCRLDKFVSHLAELPRSKTKAGIKRKLATVNGEVITSFDYSVTQDDEVLWQGKPLRYLGKRYFMLNKPVGYICANSDDMHATVFDLLNEPNMPDFHVAGRLDIDTTGLVLVSNDGEWSHRITSPRHKKMKTYLVETAEPVSDDDIEQLEQGVQLHGERQPTLPAKAERLAPYQVRLSISEGKYHQVKRMFAAIGNKVVELHREAIGDVMLDDALAPGEYRELSEQERAALT